MPPASSAKVASHADGFVGPPAASSTTPTAHAPRAERPKPTVECSASVAPRCVGVALALVPDVSAPLSAGTVRPYKKTKGSKNSGDAVVMKPMVNATTADETMTIVMAR